MTYNVTFKRILFKDEYFNYLLNNPSCIGRKHKSKFDKPCFFLYIIHKLYKLISKENRKSPHEIHRFIACCK